MYMEIHANKCRIYYFTLNTEVTWWICSKCLNVYKIEPYHKYIHTAYRYTCLQIKIRTFVLNSPWHYNHLRTAYLYNHLRTAYLYNRAGCNSFIIYLLQSRLDAVASLGLPIWITELDITLVNFTERADAYEDILRLYFSHASVEGIMLWGFWDQAHWRPDAALVNGDNFDVS